MADRMKVLVAAVALVVAAGCGLTGKGREVAAPTTSGPIGDTATPSEEPTLEDVATDSPSPTPSKSASKKPKPAKPTPTGPVNNFQHADCFHYEGKAITKTSAKSALNAAAAKHYWPLSAPALAVPSDLVRAVAWNESGWQSNIVNCDGGRGLMQVMPDTEEMINNRFGQSLDAHDYRQNAVIGANYLAWLTKYFGDEFFKKSYNLSASKCKTHASPCLLNLVIAAYNSGFGTVDAAYQADKSLPNPQYVDSVRSLMSSCYCDRY